MSHRFHPDDPLECPECEDTNLTAEPYPDMDEQAKGPATSLVVPIVCDDCGTRFEAVYQYNSIGY